MTGFFGAVGLTEILLFVIAKRRYRALADGVASTHVALYVDYFAGVEDFTGGCIELGQSAMMLILSKRCTYNSLDDILLRLPCLMDSMTNVPRLRHRVRNRILLDHVAG